MRTVARIALVALVAAVGGCDEEDQEAADMAAAAPSLQLTQSQAAQVLLTANQGELQVAQAAAPRLVTPQGQSFAARMRTEHAEALAREQPLFQEIGIVGSDSDANQQLLAATERDLAALAAAPPGRATDLTYLCSQVRAHLAVSQVIRQRMYVVAAGPPPFIEEVQLVLATVEDHLAQAQGFVIQVAGQGTVGAASTGPGTGGPMVDAACASYGGSAP